MLPRKPIDPGRVAVYIRWSTEDQGEGHTLEVQRESCRQVFRERNWEWNEALVYVDAGESGTTLERPALTRLRRAVLERKIDCVVVYRLDRISRKTVDTLAVVQEEWENLCHLVSATEPISTLDGMAEVVLPILSTIGEMDRNRIIANTKAGRYAAVKKGRIMGRLPYGYKCGKNPGQIEADDSKAAIVQRIFREYLQGNGLTALAAALNREGIPSPYGARWNSSGIGHILQNEAYVGRYVYAKNLVNPRKRRHKQEQRYLRNDRPIVAENAFPPLVADEEFAAVQRIRARRADRRRGRRGLSGDFLLSRLATCSECGFPLGGVRNGTGTRYYGCQGAMRRLSACNGKLMRAVELEELVMHAVRAEFGPADPGELAAAVRREQAQRVRDARAAAEAAAGELNKVRAARRKWLHAFEQGSVQPEQVSERLADLARIETERNTACKEAFSRLQLAENRQRGLDPAALVAAAGHLRVWDAVHCDQRKHVLQLLVRHIQAYASPHGTRRMVMTFNTEEGEGNHHPHDRPVGDQN